MSSTPSRSEVAARRHLVAGRALAELLDVEGVSVVEVLRRCRGELGRSEIERLKTLARPPSDVRRSPKELPRLPGMSANRDELIHLIEGMPDDQVAVLLAGAKRLAGSRPRGTWPPEFVGMIKVERYQQVATHLSVVRTSAPDPSLVAHLSGPSDGSTAVGRGGVS